MKRRVPRTATALLLLASGGTAGAQVTPPAEPLGGRVGPEGAAPELPAFPTPRPVLPQAAEPAPPAPPPARASALLISDVSIASDPAMMPAVPAPSWQPRADNGSGLQLEHRPGEALDAAWIRRQFVANQMIGTTTSASNLVALVQLINRAFLESGFINSGVLVAGQGVPAANGVLELQLVSGRLVGATPGAEADVAVRWRSGHARGLTPGYLRDRLSLSPNGPLNAIVLERDFRLLADDPAIRSIDADLRPGTRPGEATLGLIVEPADRFDIYVSFANSRSPSIGGERLAAGASIRNLFAAGDVLAGEAGRTDDRPDYVVSYTAPLTPRTFVFARGGINKAAVVDRPLIPLDIRSRDESFEAGFQHRVVDRPLLPGGAGLAEPARRLALGALVTHRRITTTLLGEPFSFSPGAVDGRAEYTAGRLTADYVQRSVRQVWAVSLTGSIGIEGTHATAPGVISARQHFKALLAQTSYARRLSAGGLELRLRAAGQISDGVLYSGERFSVGGESSVRGYRENLLLADTGVSGSVELAQAFSLTGGEGGASGFDLGAFSASVFADGALVRNRRGAPQPMPDEIASVGVSLSWTPSPALFARISYAEALRDPIGLSSRTLQDRGVQFRVTLRPLALFRRSQRT